MSDGRLGPRPVQLRFVAGCQGSVEDGDGDGGLAGCAVGFASGVVPGHGALDDAGADAQPPAGHQAGQDSPPLSRPGRQLAGEDAGGEDNLVAGGVQGDGEAGAVGVGARDGAGGVGDGGAQHLVGDQQGAGLLVDAAGGAGAQDPAAEDGGLELEVGALDLPALAVKNGDLGGGVAGRVERVVISRQPLAACPVLVVTVISASMTRTGMPPKRDSRTRRRSGPGPEASGSSSRCGPGSGTALVPAICVARSPAPKFRSASRIMPACRLASSAGAPVVSPLDTGAEHGVDDGAGAAADQDQQPQHRVAGGAVPAAALPGVDGQVRLAAGNGHDRAVDRADQQSPPPRPARGRAAQQEEQLAQRSRAEPPPAWVIADAVGTATGSPPSPAATRCQTWV